MGMTITAHSPLFATAPQARPEDMVLVAQEGFRTVINNRPDYEGGSDQPTADAVGEAARAAGLNYIAQPFSPSQVTQALVEEFAVFVGQAEKPVLAFCRTGTRSTNIFQAAMAMGLLNPHDLTLVNVPDVSDASAGDEDTKKKALI